MWNAVGENEYFSGNMPYFFFLHSFNDTLKFSPRFSNFFPITTAVTKVTRPNDIFTFNYAGYYIWDGGKPMENINFVVLVETIDPAPRGWWPHTGVRVWNNHGIVSVAISNHTYRQWALARLYILYWSLYRISGPPILPSFTHTGLKYRYIDPYISLSYWFWIMRSGLANWQLYYIQRKRRRKIQLKLSFDPAKVGGWEKWLGFRQTNKFIHIQESAFISFIRPRLFPLIHFLSVKNFITTSYMRYSREITSQYIVFYGIRRWSHEIFKYKHFIGNWL